MRPIQSSSLSGAVVACCALAALVLVVTSSLDLRVTIAVSEQGAGEVHDAGPLSLEVSPAPEPAAAGGRVAASPAPPSTSPTTVDSVHEVDPFRAVAGDVPAELGAEALAAATVDLWAQPEFDELDPDERRALFPIDPELPVAPGRLSSIVGFPGPEDVAAAARSKEVREAQAAFAGLELVLAELQEVPKARRSADLDQVLRALRGQRDAAYLELARACDRAGPFRDWSALARLYLAWSNQGAGPWLGQR